MKIEQNSLISFFFFIKIYVNTRSCVGDDVFFKFTQFFSIIYTKIWFFFALVLYQSLNLIVLKGV